VLVVTVDFELQKDHMPAFRDAMWTQAETTLEREAGCVQFDVCFPLEGGNRCFLYEKYLDEAAFDQHLASEHFKTFDATTRAWIRTKLVHKWCLADGAPSGAS